MTRRATAAACELGIITQAVTNNLAPLLYTVFKEKFGVSYIFVANLMLLNFAVQLVTDCLSIGLIRVLGYKKTGVAAQVSAALGLILLGILPGTLKPEAGLAAAAVFYSFGGGLLEVTLTPIIDALESEGKPERMSLLHSFVCWGQVAVIFVSAAVLKCFDNNAWRILAVCWAAVPITNAFVFAAVPVPDREKADKSPKSVKSRTFIKMCVLMVCAGAAEMTMAQWASLFARDGLGVGKFAGDVFGACMFAVLMGCGRSAFGIFGGNKNLRKYLTACAVMCAACYITAAVSKNPCAALAACALTGLAVSIMWPGVYSYSSRKTEVGGAEMFGILALFGDVGCSLGTWLCGAVSDAAAKIGMVSEYAAKIGMSGEQLGLRLGIGLTAVFPLVMIAVLKLSKE